MINDKETNNLIEIRDRQKELREKQGESEEFIKEIEKLNTICFALSGNVKFEREKNESIKKEIIFRKKHLEDTEKNYRSFLERDKPESKFFVMEIKNKLIREKLIDLLTDRIPELVENNAISSSSDLYRPKFNISDENKEQSENEFKNLIIDHVHLTYVQYEENQTGKELTDRQSFRISSISNFKTLKKVACQYWDIENENDFVITDEAEAILYYEEASINQWMLDYSVLVNSFKLIPINALKGRIRLVGNQENRIRDNNKLGVKFKKENIIIGNSLPDQSAQKMKEFFNEYPGLRPYTLISDNNEKSGEEKEKKMEGAEEQAKNIETSFIMLLNLTLFFVFNLIFIYGTRNIEMNNQKIKYVEYLFDNSNITNYSSLYNWFILKIFASYSSTGSYTSQNIFSENENMPFYTNSKFSFDTENIDNESWFKHTSSLSGNKTVKYLQPEPFYDYINKIRNKSVNFYFVSSIKIIMSRVKNKDCTTNKIVNQTLLTSYDKCYEIYHDSTTTDTNLTYDNIDNRYKSEEWLSAYFKNFAKYKNAEDMGLTFNIDTSTGSYDGSGYHLDITKSIDIIDLMCLFTKMIPTSPTFGKPTNSTTYSSLNDANTYFLVDSQVRSLMVLFTIYFPYEDEWMSCLISFDFLPTGALLPGKLEFKMFKPDIYSDSSMIATDIIRMVIAFIFLVFMFVDYFQKAKKEDQSDENSFPLLTHFLSAKTFLNLFIFILYVISFAFKFQHCYKSEDDYYNIDGTNYIDTYSLASYYNEVFYYESLLSAAVMTKILTFLRLNDNVKLFFASIEMGLSIFVKYFSFFIVILVIYACIALMLWGPYIDNFDSFGQSFLQILFFTMGYFNPNEMLQYNSEWTVVFLGSFFLFMLFFMYTIFISLYAESLRRTVIKYGYPEDHQLSRWTLKDYMTWLLFFLRKNKKKDD